MRFSYPLIDTVFHFKNGEVNSLVVENSAFFTEIVSDIYNQCSGGEGGAVLSIDYTPVPFSKNAELLMQFIPFDVNRKNLLNKLCGALEKNALSSEFFLQTQTLLQNIEKWLMDISFSLPCDIDCTKLSPAGLLKALGIAFRDDAVTFGEKLLNYMELVRELEGERLFIFVNLRSYLPENDCQGFFASAAEHEYKLFLIDSCEKKRCPHENRVVIDNDLCEI